MNTCTSYQLRTVVFALCLAAAAPALATISVPYSVTELLPECSQIYAGEVLSVTPWSSDAEQSQVRRTAQVRVDRVLKGNPAGKQTVEIVLPQPPLDGDFDRSVKRSPFQVLFLCSESDGLHLCKDSVNGSVNSAIAVSRRAPAGEQPRDALQAVIREMTNSLDDPNAAVVARAVDVLGEIGDAQVVIRLRGLSGSAQADVAPHALVALVRLGDLSALPEAVNYILQSRDTSRMPSDLYSAIENVKDPSAAGLLYPILRSEGNDTAKCAVLRAFRRMKSEQVLPEVQKLLDAPSWEVRYQAVMVLAQTTGDYAYAPAIPTFNADEAKYIAYWKKWVPKQ